MRLAWSCSISARSMGWSATMRHLILALGVLAAVYAVVRSAGGFL